MNDQSRAPTRVNGYHAHVYYDTETKPIAERLAEAIGRQFTVKFGGFHDGPVGPHPVANLQIIFTTAEFANVVPWLMLNREGLDVLIHPLSDDFGRRSQHLCDVARHAGSAEARNIAARLSAGTAADRLKRRIGFAPAVKHGRASAKDQDLQVDMAALNGGRRAVGFGGAILAVIAAAGRRQSAGSSTTAICAMCCST